MIKILYLELNPDDVSLVSECLLQEGIDFKLNHVYTREAFIEKLESETFDIILSDYNLLTFNAKEALLVAHEICNEVPFICVSGSIGDDVELELLKLGVSAFVPKDKLYQLPFVIQRLQQVVNTRLELVNSKNQLHKIELRLFKLFNSNPVAIAFSTFDDGKMIEVNDSFVELLGFSREETIGHTSMELGIVSVVNRQSAVQKLDKQSNLNSYEIQLRCKHGRIIEAIIASQVIDLNDQKVIQSVIYDITDRKQAEIAVKKSLENWQVTFDAMNDSIFLLDNEGKILQANKISQYIFGKSEDEIIGRYCYEITHNAHCRVGSCPYMKMVTSRKRENRVFMFQEKWVEITVDPVFDAQNNLQGSVHIFSDITKRKDQEVELQKNHDLLKAVIQGTMDPFFVKDRQGRYLFCNDAAAKIISPDGKPILGFDDTHFFPSEIAFSLMENDQKIMKSGKTEELEETVLINGKTAHFLSSKSVLRNTKGQIIGLIGSARNITLRKQAEEKSRKLYQGIVQSPALVIITDRNGLIEFVNPRFCEITDYTSEEVIGKTPRILKSGYISKEGYKKIWDFLLAGKVWKGEFFNRKKNGEHFWESSSIAPIFDEKNEITHFIQIGEDISDRKKLLSDLIVAKNMAEESDKLKTAFLNNISHEIRTPFNGILGFLSMIQEDDLSPSVRDEYIGIINQSAERLMNTISDIVEISQIQAGLIKLKYSKVNVRLLIEKLLAYYKASAEHKKLSFTFNCIMPDHLQEVNTDVVKLNAILSILVGNAIKFTKEGTIEVGVKLNNLKKRKDSGEFEFYVKDTGVGISEKNIDLIFNRFIQADFSLNREFEGSGLGLSIARNYVELLGGKIWVASTPGQGATFSFTLPFGEKLKLTI